MHQAGHAHRWICEPGRRLSGTVGCERMEMAKPEILCKMCREVGPAADSHIIPRAFYEQSKAGHDFLKVISSIEGSRSTRSRIGFYDRELLCQGCEAKFQPIDDYGINLLLHAQLEPYGPGHMAGLHVSMIRNVDPQRFNDFLSFLVWRVLASDQPAFQSIRNPGEEERLRNALQFNRIRFEPFIQALMFRIEQSIGLPENVNSVLNGTAFKDRFEGVPMVNIGLGEFLLKVKLGMDALPPPFDDLSFPGCLGKVGGLLIMGEESYSNRHIRVVQKVVRDRHEEGKTRDLARRVMKRFPHPALKKKPHA